MTSSTAVEAKLFISRYQSFLVTASYHIQTITIFTCTTQNIFTFISDDSVTRD
jgi:hypothetical protein